MDANFWEDYEAFADNAAGAAYTMFPNALKRWFALIDNEPVISSETKRLEGTMDFGKWLAGCEASRRGMGVATLDFPIETAQRLGAHLFLVRSAAQDLNFATGIGHTFLTTENHYGIMIAEFQRQIFQPLRSDLRRHLERLPRRAEATSDASREMRAPASDRVVQLNHNSLAYTDAIESLNKIRDAVIAQNDYEDAEDKAQRIAELAAGKELLKAPQVRMEAAKAVLFRCLKYLADKFADNLIGELVKVAIVALVTLLGLHFLG